MPKVLRIINRLNLGGPTYNAAYLSKYLGKDYETLLVAGEKDESEASSLHIVNSLNLSPIIIPEMRRALNPYYDAIALIKLIQIMRKYKPDIVHTHAAKAGTLGRLAAWICGVPKIYHTFHGHVFHSYFSKTKTVFYIWIERFLARISTKIIAISKLQMKELIEDFKIFPKNKGVIVPLGFDLNRFTEDIENKRANFREKYLVAKDEIAIGIVGRLVPIKNHAFFIDLVEALIQKNNHFRFFIIGDGECLKEIQHYATKKNIPHSYKTASKSLLCFTSWIRKMDWAYAGLDIICLTSDNEGTPVSLIEAQAAGKSIVSTDVGGVRDINFSPLNFKIHPKGNLNEFEKSVIELANSLNSVNKKQNTDVEDVVKLFSYQRLCSDIRDLYAS